MDKIPLNFLAAGQFARVDQIVGTLEQVRRLEELGMRCGAWIEMLCPGEACIIRHDGRRLCFRGSEAIGILVQPSLEGVAV